MDSLKSTASDLSSSLQTSGTTEGQQGTVTETLSKGVDYLQEKTIGKTGDSNDSSVSESSGGSADAPSKQDVREAHPEKIQEFLRDKYKSDPNDFPDVKKGNE